MKKDEELPASEAMYGVAEAFNSPPLAHVLGFVWTGGMPFAALALVCFLPRVLPLMCKNRRSAADAETDIEDRERLLCYAVISLHLAAGGVMFFLFARLQCFMTPWLGMVHSLNFNHRSWPRLLGPVRRAIPPVLLCGTLATIYHFRFITMKEFLPEFIHAAPRVQIGQTTFADHNAKNEMFRQLRQLPAGSVVATDMASSGVVVLGGLHQVRTVIHPQIETSRIRKRIDVLVPALLGTRTVKQVLSVVLQHNATHLLISRLHCHPRWAHLAESGNQEALKRPRFCSQLAEKDQPGFKKISQNKEFMIFEVLRKNKSKE